MVVYFKEDRGDGAYIVGKAMNLPDGAEEITEAEYLIEVSGLEVLGATEALAEPTQVNINALVRDEADRRIELIGQKYRGNERATFSQQVAEAEAWTATGAVGPFLTGKTQRSGEAVEDAVARILANRDAFASASGQILGQQDVFLNGNPTAAEVADDSNWPST